MRSNQPTVVHPCNYTQHSTKPGNCEIDVQNNLCENNAIYFLVYN